MEHDHYDVVSMIALRNQHGWPTNQVFVSCEALLSSIHDALDGLIRCPSPDCSKCHHWVFFERL